MHLRTQPWHRDYPDLLPDNLSRPIDTFTRDDQEDRACKLRQSRCLGELHSYPLLEGEATCFKLEPLWRCAGPQESASNCGDSSVEEFRLEVIYSVFVPPPNEIQPPAIQAQRRSLLKPRVKRDDLFKALMRWFRQRPYSSRCVHRCSLHTEAPSLRSPGAERSRREGCDRWLRGRQRTSST